ncbi:hypothetical protein ACX27_26655 [Nostoc piscinale CENA21]|uniref:Uncharacterized protein n=1 Tax=Nostoc piscinale CENA21 TaxID=224013 RepID=A0A0M4SQ31_9NOSO|nr:hypothetical protein [Nostoc piscinale]ALF55610.1 hypothetical protein ACX27_26655 [Nostoc piscinale CENA21]
MATLTGTFENGSAVVPGKLVLTLANGTVKDTAPKKVFLPKPIEILCPSGVVPGSTNVEETETKNTSYLLEYFPRISTSPDVFSEDQLAPFPFYAVIPNLASVDIADLVPTGMVSDVLATGAVRVARVIAGDPALAASIGGITPKGDYNAATSYKRGDVVAYLNRFFLASEVIPFSGIVPTNTSFWMEIPVAPTGSVALGDSTVYGAAWDNSGLAPTQDSVYDVIQSTLSAVAAKANSTDAILAGNPTAPTQATGNNSTRIATTAFVANTLSSSPALGGNPTAPTPAAGDSDTSIATTAFVSGALSGSPALGGTPTATTPPTTNNSTRIATTAYVQAQRFNNPVLIVQQRTTGQTIPHSSTTVMTYNTTVVDTAAGYSSATGYTVPTGGGGIYWVQARVVFTAGCTRMLLEVFVNGVQAGRLYDANPTTDALSCATGSAIISVPDGAIITIRCFQLNTSSASRLTAVTVNSHSELSLFRLHAN